MLETSRGAAEVVDLKEEKFKREIITPIVGIFSTIDSISKKEIIDKLTDLLKVEKISKEDTDDIMITDTDRKIFYVSKLFIDWLVQEKNLDKNDSRLIDCAEVFFGFKDNNSSWNKKDKKPGDVILFNKT